MMKNSNKAEIKKSKMKKPEFNKLEFEKPEVNKPEISKPEVNKPEGKKSEIKKSEINKQEVNKQEVKKQKKGRVFISNLIYDINEKLLKKLLNKYGEIIDINIPINNTNNKPKGYAFIEFKNKNNALKAIQELNNTKYKGRNITLSMSLDKRKFEEENLQKEESKVIDLEVKDKQKKEEDDISENDSLNFENNDDLEDNNDQSKKMKEENEEDEEEDEEDKAEIAKNKFKDENLSQTIFIKNIQFEVNKKQFYNFFRKFGEIVYAKLCMLKTDEEGLKHKGTGFVKFKNQSIAMKLINDSEKIEENPLLASKIDPLNKYELSERRLVFKKALNKENIVKHEGDDSKKKRKTIKMMISEDKNNKRNLVSCLYGTISSLRPENISQREIQIRKTYLKEKLQKIQNCNLFCSKTSVIFKNINEDLNEVSIKENIKKILLKYVDKNEIVNKKIVKRIKLFLKSNNIGFSGICIVDFKKSSHATSFLENIIEKENYSLFLNKLKFVPIIEFSFEDIRKVKSYEEKLLKKKIEKNKNKNKIDLIKKKDTINDNIINEQQKNRKNLANRYVKLYLQNNNEEDKNTALEYINKLKSRGLKHRLLKKLDISNKINTNEAKEENIVKHVKNSKPEKIEIKKKIFKNNKDNSIEYKINKDLKFKKKLKKKNFEKEAELNEFEKKYLKIN